MEMDFIFQLSFENNRFSMLQMTFRYKINLLFKKKKKEFPIKYKNEKYFCTAETFIEMLKLCNGISAEHSLFMSK